MFSAAGHFAQTPCPLNENCPLPNCLFKHTADVAQRARMTMPEEESTAQSEVSSKRRRPNQSLSFGNGVDLVKGKEHLPFGAPEASLGSSKTAPRAPLDQGNLSTSSNHTNGDSYTIASRQKPISPPNLQRASVIGRPADEPKEVLNPRMLTRAPADHKTRMIYLKKMHEEMSRLNDLVKNEKEPDARDLRLSDNQLIKLALDEEEKIAHDSSSIYANVIKLRMVAYKKMSLEQWKKTRLETCLKTDNPASKPVQYTKPLDMDLPIDQQVKILARLFAQQKGLEHFGYVTTPPSEAELKLAKDGVEAAAGYESCERCQARFRVFPDRREDGALTSGGKCTYHHGRAIFPPREKTDHITGAKEKIWTCCKEPLSTCGCTTADHHVFKVYDGKRLATVLQYECTPENHTVPDQQAVCFDCEMGFTVLGMELLRLTATRWPDGKELLDVLVRPLGTILDLNSRYSGIWPEHFSKATPYTDGSTGLHPDAKDGSLHVVESPMAARQLLFSLLSPRTPLIGHAIENDLNAVRVVHPCIIDTVLLYPHPAGLPQRQSLKGLVKTYIWKDIQTAGAAGHDSKEDARATGDMVKLKVIREWRRMQREGWRSEGINLIPPSGGLKAVQNAPIEDGRDNKRKRSETPGLDYD